MLEMCHNLYFCIVFFCYLLTTDVSTFLGSKSSLQQCNKKLSYHRGTAGCTVPAKILSTAAQLHEKYSFYHPTDGGRLSRPRYGNKDFQNNC